MQYMRQEWMFVLFIILILVIIYFVVNSKPDSNKPYSENGVNSNKPYPENVENIENFTAISGMEGPLTTYDDYGTFNFLFHTDDLPYYDPTYFNLLCSYRDYVPDNGRKCGSLTGKQNVDEDFNSDSFIDFEGWKVRRELIPSNYSNKNYADADFDRNQLHLAIKKDRPQASAYPPQPHNVYFNKIPRNRYN
jgi:hypothetical protein